MNDFYELIDHTGDVGVVVRGSSLQELFVNSAVAMMDVITNREKVKSVLTRSIEAEGLDVEDLLVRWLSEINYHVSTHHELYGAFTIELLGGNRVKGIASGELYDESKHELKTEIKAVTYHGLYVKKTRDGYEARVIFDI